MKLSYFTMPLHPLRRDYTETLSEDRAAVMLAEAFVGEHVTGRAETITSCLVFLASLAYQTERITLGSGTLNLPNAHRAKLLEAWASSGRAINFADWRVAKSVFVADDEKTARAYALNAHGPYGHYYRSLMRKLIGHGRPDLFKSRADMPDGEVTHDFVMNSLVICGTPAQVSERILALREEVGEFGTLVYAGHDWADVALARRSMELMAREVMPAVNRALGEVMN